MNRKTKSILTFAWPGVHLCILAVLFTVSLVSCHSGPGKMQTDSSHTGSVSIPSVIAQNDSLDAVVKSIIEISANDFYKNQQPLPASFRNVQVKYSIKPNKEVLYILCGEFATQDKQKNDEWTHFTTIKNSDYEQWIGPNGLTYCENSKEIPYPKADLSTVLKNRLDSLRKTEK